MNSSDEFRIIFGMEATKESLADVEREMGVVSRTAAAVNIDTDDIAYLKRQLILAVSLVQQADMIVETTAKIVAAAQEVVELAMKKT